MHRVLSEQMVMTAGDPFVLENAARDAGALQTYLRKRGWNEARVTMMQVKWNRLRSRVDLVYKVAAGPLYVVTDVRIELSTRAPKVSAEMEQPEFDKPVVEFEELIEEFEDATILSKERAREYYGTDIAQLSDPQKGKYFSAYDLDEMFANDEFLINGDPGSLDRGISGKIRALFARKGYSNISLEITPVFTSRKFEHEDWDESWPSSSVSLIVRIDQGYKSYVGDISFTNNETTRDEVLRRVVSLYPGDVYDRVELDRSANRLRRSGWFDQASPGAGVIPRASTRDAKVDGVDIQYTDVVFDLGEGRAGSFNFTAGFNTNTGVTVSSDLSLTNFDISSLVSWMWGEPNFSFTGAGQQLRLTAQPPVDRTQVYRASFTEPWLFGYPFSGGLSGEFRTTDYGDYTRGRTGIDPTFGWRIVPDLTLSLGYSYSIVRLFDLSSDAPLELQLDRGRTELSEVWTSLTWNTLDNPIFATRGVRLSGTYRYTGGYLGGDVDFWRVEAEAEAYAPIAHLDDRRPIVFGVNIHTAWQDVHTDSDRIPFVQRFLLGGNTISGRGILRGFEYSGVGPSRNEQAIGGNFLVHGSAELRMAVMPGALWLVYFVDAGELAPTLNTFDPEGFTVSAGVGLRLLLPILPVPFALDIGFPIVNQPGNREELISVNLGFGF